MQEEVLHVDYHQGCFIGIQADRMCCGLESQGGWSNGASGKDHERGLRVVLPVVIVVIPDLDCHCECDLCSCG